MCLYLFAAVVVCVCVLCCVCNSININSKHHHHLFFAVPFIFVFRKYFLRRRFLYRGDERRVNLSIKIPPPVGESRFLVLAGVRRVATSLSRRVLLSGGVDAVRSCLKERRRRVSLNVFAVFVLFGGCALKPEN